MTRHRSRLSRAVWAGLLSAGDVALDLAADARFMADDLRAGVENIARDVRSAWRST